MIKILKILFFFFFIIIIYFSIEKDILTINKTQNYIFQQKINNIIKKEKIFQKQKLLIDWIDIFWLIENKTKRNSIVKHEIRYNNYIYIKKLKVLYIKIKFKKYIFFKSYNK